MEALLQFGEDFSLEPRVFVDPVGIAPGRMGKGKEIGGIFAPGADGLGEGFFAAWAEVMGLGVLADEEGELAVGKVGEEFVEPVFGAFSARGQVAATGVAAGVAIAHGDDGDAGGVVERVAVNVHPCAEPIAAGVVPGDAGFVDLCAGRLADDEDAGGGLEAEDGIGPEGEFLRADAAGAYFL